MSLRFLTRCAIIYVGEKSLRGFSFKIKGNLVAK